MWKIAFLYGIFNSRLGGILSGIPVWEEIHMRHKAEKMGRNRGQGIIIGFLVFVIAVISICTIIFRSYVREFHKVTERKNMTSIM